MRFVCSACRNLGKEVLSVRLLSGSTSKFWEKLPMDTKQNFSSAYHLQIDEQTERTNQIFEDMLRAFSLKYEKG
jgi:hypothetical protein